MANAVPRDLALQVLTRVLSDRVPLDIAFGQVLDQARELDSQERAWLRDVCSGTLRWKGRLDQAVDSTALKKKPSGWLRKVLLIAAYQLILQERVAPAVVVNETVSLVKSKEGESPAKFANASLRKIAESAAVWRTLPFPKNGSASEQSTWASVPEWFWNKMVFQRGLEWAEKYASACSARPEIWIHSRARDGAQLGEAGPVEGAYRLTQGGLISEQEGFSEGLFFVQDISSQFLISEISLTVKAALGSPTQQSPLCALDLCSAPGGKSLGLGWNGFHVSATDQDPERMKLVSQNITRLGTQIADAGGAISVIPRAQVASLSAQDLVWVDAPCSGSGIIRRHPDVRWLRQESDLVALRRTQEDLLREAWEKTKPGGFVAYTVCSVFEDEGMGALKRAGLSSYAEREWLLGPHMAPGGDGFWGALLRKPVS
jgi:16S rRNA (cytosine967-C5)-methyltransferase